MINPLHPNRYFVLPPLLQPAAEAVRAAHSLDPRIFPALTGLAIASFIHFSSNNFLKGPISESISAFQKCYSKDYDLHLLSPEGNHYREIDLENENYLACYHSAKKTLTLDIEHIAQLANIIKVYAIGSAFVALYCTASIIYLISKSML